jgi:hypothetical protein
MTFAPQREQNRAASFGDSKPPRGQVIIRQLS